MALLRVNQLEAWDPKIELGYPDKATENGIINLKVGYNNYELKDGEYVETESYKPVTYVPFIDDSISVPERYVKSKIQRLKIKNDTTTYVPLRKREFVKFKVHYNVGPNHDTTATSYSMDALASNNEGAYAYTEITDYYMYEPHFIGNLYNHLYALILVGYCMHSPTGEFEEYINNHPYPYDKIHYFDNNGYYPVWLNFKFYMSAQSVWCRKVWDTSYLNFSAITDWKNENELYQNYWNEIPTDDNIYIKAIIVKYKGGFERSFNLEALPDSDSATIPHFFDWESRKFSVQSGDDFYECGTLWSLSKTRTASDNNGYYNYAISYGANYLSHENNDTDDSELLVPVLKEYEGRSYDDSYISKKMWADGEFYSYINSIDVCLDATERQTAKYYDIDSYSYYYYGYYGVGRGYRCYGTTPDRETDEYTIWLE